MFYPYEFENRVDADTTMQTSENRADVAMTQTPGNRGNVPRTNRPQTTPPINIVPNNRNTPPGGPSFNQVPRSAPPNTIPQRTVNPLVDASTIRNCIGSFTYVWLRGGAEFWIFPILVGQRSLAGFRWNRRFGWVYFGVNLNQIISFMCVPS